MKLGLLGRVRWVEIESSHPHLTSTRFRYTTKFTRCNASSHRTLKLNFLPLPNFYMLSLHYTYTQISKRQNSPQNFTLRQPYEMALINATTRTYILLCLEHLRQLIMTPETPNFEVRKTSISEREIRHKADRV
jgi:hypothetical protein